MSPTEHRTDLKVVNVGSLCVIQADNAHVWVYDKKSEQMILHINTTTVYSVETLTEFAEQMLSEAGRLPMAIWTLQ